MKVTWWPNKLDMARGVVVVLGAILDFIYPPHCLLCRVPLEGERTGLCKSCRIVGQAWMRGRGPRCGCPAGVEMLPAETAPGRFNDSMQIHILKYEGRAPVGQVLGQALGEALKGDSLVAGATVAFPYRCTAAGSGGTTRAP